MTVASPAAAQQDPDPPDLTATPLEPAETISGSKTSGIAETDPELLGRADGEAVQVVVKLDYDSTAAYQGGVEGLAATSPAVTARV